MSLKAILENADRRSFLINFFGAGTISGLALTGIVRSLFAMGAFKYPAGIQKLKGRVLINNIPAEEGDIVAPGDTVETKSGSMVIFIVGKSVYLLRANTRIKIEIDNSNSKSNPSTEIVRIVNGKVLAVFNRKRNKRIVTQTAVAGIRGSAAYVESESERTYICLCYGKADLIVRDNPSIRESIRTSYHESPRYIYSASENKQIVPAPVINHTDAELIMLEAIAWRKPPFAESSNGGGGY